METQNQGILKTGEKQLSLPAKIEDFPKLQTWLQIIAEEISLPHKTLRKIFVAIDEIFTNIAAYAYPKKDGNLDITAYFDAQGSILTLVFSDQGIPFNPLDREDPDITLPLTERAVGGLGIFMVKQLMDGVEYHRENRCNILTLTKKFTPENMP